MDNERKVQYYERFREFVQEMNHLQDENDLGIKRILEGVCSLLEISGMVVWFYETPMKEAIGQGEFFELFGSLPEQSGEIRMQRRHVTGGGNVVRYDVYVKDGESAWSKWQEEETGTLLDTVFSYHGKIRTGRIAERLTFWDVDFGLRNMRYFMKTIGEKIARKQLVGYVACVYNLKRFSVVNELVGREAGTKVMIRYAKGLEALYQPDGLVGHLGGDNFLALFRRDKLDAVQQYFRGVSVTYDEVSGEHVFVSATAGFYIISDMEGIHGPDDVMEGAYVSSNMAKKSENEDIIFWNEQIKARQFRKKKIENIFPDALENEEFKVYYQPKFSLKDEYKLVGAEALCRWFHEGKMIYPDDFIPVLEQSANICKLDFYMLDHVCRDIKRWVDAGKEIGRVSVNLSRKHLTDQNLLAHILEIVDRNKIPHEYIEIELTETTTDVDFKDLKRVANGLHECGISTSVDDFGMGYSSLNLIRDVSWDVLKVDRSFLPETEDSGDDNKKKGIMLKHVIQMAQELGLQCIVEGVETEEHIQLLKKNRCYLAQGYYFDKPLPVEMFEKRLEI
ncbi:MAG: GGDEF domain-containing phosphodiesterase [Bacteroidales bacterium]|nr:GGDEF domain-containing phosphodiesterase [Clostridium sp.]MCM1202674.1 GGDEF domain-containing phosphodiesterase [Bacteroidales bacterium]